MKAEHRHLICGSGVKCVFSVSAKPMSEGRASARPGRAEARPSVGLYSDDEDLA